MVIELISSCNYADIPAHTIGYAYLYFSLLLMIGTIWPSFLYFTYVKNGGGNKLLLFPVLGILFLFVASFISPFFLLIFRITSFLSLLVCPYFYYKCAGRNKLMFLFIFLIFIPLIRDLFDDGRCALIIRYLFYV